MLFAVLSGFLFAALLPFLGRHLKGRLALIFALLPASLFGWFCSSIGEISAGQTISFHTPWIPSLGLNLDFRLDGLSLLFSLLITGIGTLVFVYAFSYLKGHPYLDRFFGYLTLFMASMLGLVLSDNLLLLFIFWELTSISSFFLIGFNQHDQASRKSALMALAVTGGGGFLLMIGLVMIGAIGGTYSIELLIERGISFQNDPLYGLVLFFVFAGAFTKSAQFPFHFWLPGAMKAPTPVSAYLHSATMVKVGIYLLARLTPVLGGHSYWTVPLMIVGGVTMLFAAFHSIFRTDLKGILAYSTIGALGVLVFLIGIGTEEGLLAAAVFIFVHALYKASLFLITGVIDYQTGTRDVTRLRGMRKVLFPLAIAGFLAALSSAGVPFTFGFIGKDLIYEATLHSEEGWAWILTSVAVVTNCLLLYAGFQAGIKPFVGDLPDEFASVRTPDWLMVFSPIVLSCAGILLGCFPGLIDAALVRPVVASMGGIAATPLKIWHGFNLVLQLSGLTLALGIGLYFFRKTSYSGLESILRFDPISPERIVKWGAHQVHTFSVWYTNTLHNGFLRSYILTIIFFLIALLSYKIVLCGIPIYIDYSKLSSVTFYESIVIGITLVALVRVVSTSSRLTAVAAMGVIGYCICLLFVFYSAPDLAMTQFTIDTLTVVLFVLVLFRLPSFLNFANRKVMARDGIMAVAFGSLIGLIALLVLNESVNEETSIFYAENAYLLAKGKNVVNVILVDFRGFDTLFEITVLTIATIGVFSLLKLKISFGEKD